MKIKRYILPKIKQNLTSGKVVVIYGPRQVGKTTLLNETKSDLKEKTLFVSGEDRFVQEWMSSRSIAILKRNIGDYKILIIDEAQHINQIGLNLKLIVDHIEDIKVIATGSSSFELANQIGEPLVGRKWQFDLFPIAQIELKEQEDYSSTKENLPERLIFGSYPELITTVGPHKKKQLLNSIVDYYLFKDILALKDLKRSQKLIDILKLLAFQIGKEVSISELANNLNVNFTTVEHYLDLLSKIFIIIRVDGFSRNLRKEITKNSRYYFYDNGIRNAVINNFNDLKTRDDVGQLWENYIVLERLKKRTYTQIFANQYFWRTYDKKEIDLVEEREGKLYGYEIKWSAEKQPKAPKIWLDTYKNASYEVINRENYLDFIT